MLRGGSGRAFASLAAGLGCALALQTATHLVEGDGRGFAPHVALRLQTEALLRGELALQPHPFGAQHDWLWGRGGVYQPWGLGVPLLRLPAEALARGVGAVGFPDRYVFLAFFGLAAAVLFSALRGTLRRPGEGDPWYAALLGTAFITLFPTFVVLVDSRFSVYEEVEAWGCVWAVLTLGLLLRTCAEPHLGRLLLLAASVAFAPCVRLTGALTGGIALGIAVLHGLRAGAPRLHLALAAAVALLGPLTILLLNTARFGDATEFGFALVLSGPHVNELQRLRPPRGFGDLGSGVLELVHVAFAPESATHAPNSRRLWTGAPTSRFVDVYFAPLRPSMLLAALACALPWIVIWRRRRVGRGGGPGSGLEVLASWGLLVVFALGLFFSWTPAITSRYVAELSPALASWLLAGALLSLQFARERGPRLGRLLGIGLCSVAVAWFAGRQTDFLHVFHAPIDSRGVSRALARSRPRLPVEIPSRLDCGSWPSRPYEIGWNLSGWSADCRFRSGLQAVLPASECIELDVAMPPGAVGGSASESIAALRVKSDLRELQLEPRSTTKAVTRLRFCETEPAPWRLAGLQLVTIGRGPDRGLRLHSIRASGPSDPTTGRR